MSNQKIRESSIYGSTRFAAQGFHLKERVLIDLPALPAALADVVLASTVNVNLAANLVDTVFEIDGVVVTAGIRVLLKNQTESKENGVYLVADGMGATGRAGDAGENDLGANFSVTSGTVNTGKSFFVGTAPTVLDFNPLYFQEFPGSGGQFASAGALTKRKRGLAPFP